MGIFDRFRSKPKLVVEAVFPPPVDGIFLPSGCTREGLTMVIYKEYSQQWFNKYPDSRQAVKEMLAFLKSQYPAISSFIIRK